MLSAILIALTVAVLVALLLLLIRHLKLLFQKHIRRKMLLAQKEEEMLNSNFEHSLSASTGLGAPSDKAARKKAPEVEMVSSYSEPISEGAKQGAEETGKKRKKSKRSRRVTAEEAESQVQLEPAANDPEMN